MEAKTTDEWLIRKYLRGDEGALKLLIGRYLKPVYNFVYRYTGSAADAEDITQDAFVSAWKNIKKPVLSLLVANSLNLLKGFDPQKGKFKAWIFAIAKNASLNWIKKKKPSLFSEFSAEGGEDENRENSLTESLADPSPLPDELFAAADLREKLSAAMEKLEPNRRMVLFLRYNDHLTFREIAESLGEPLHTVKSRHRRALMSLKNLLVS